MKRWWAMVWARSLEFLRDRSALGWNIAFPLLVVGGMGFAFSGPGQPLFKVAVLSDKPLAELTLPFLKTEQTRFYVEQDATEAMSKVRRERIDMLLDLRATPPQYWINPASNKGRLLEKLLAGSGLQAQAQTLAGTGVRYVDWLAPGVLGMNMMFSCLFGIGYVIVRYRKSGYLKRLNATPLRAFEFIAAQLFSRLVLVMLIVSTVFAGCNFFIHFHMEGSYLDLFLLTLLAAVTMLSLGLMVAARVTSEELAGGLLNLLSWPMMVISGVFFSLDGAPPVLRVIAQAFPLTHLNDAARAIMLDGATLGQVMPNLAALAGMAALFLAVGAGFFRWTQD
jgi:ABC-2 type transport system permease protein